MATWLVVFSGSGTHYVEYSGLTITPAEDNHLIYLWRMPCNINYVVSGNVGTIEYQIVSGILPMTVTLSGATTNLSNYHTIYESGQFTGVTNEILTLTFSDNNDCVTGETLDSCVECFTGYTPTLDGDCYKIDSYNAPISGTTFTIDQGLPNSSYNTYGAAIFSDWNYNGTGTYERFGLDNTYWTNLGSNTGPLNREVVWASQLYNNQDVGFSYCINLGVGKTYYIGFGCDNYGKIKLNGEFILSQSTSALGGMFYNNGDPYGGTPYPTYIDRVTFRYWYIYPVFIPSGDNIIEIFGHNVSNAAGVGIVIYDATKNDLVNAKSDSDLGSKILFQSSSLDGNNLNYSYHIDISGNTFYNGYYCDDGYGLNTCSGTVTCDKKLVIDCGETPTTTTTTTVT